MRETRWARLAQGVYAIGQQPSWRGLAWAGLLIAGPHAVLGGLAAGHLHGLWEAPSSIDVWSPTRPSRIRGPWRFRAGARSGHGSPPRVDHATAVLEAASELDGRALSTCIYAALNTRRTSVASLSARLSDFPQLPRRAVIEEALLMAGDGVESVLEGAFLKLVRGHGLPTGYRQVTLSARSRSDAANDDYGVVVELDGRLGHDGVNAFRDADRDNEHAVDGWITLRFGWWDVIHDPCKVTAILARTLESRGWAGRTRSCRRRCG